MAKFRELEREVSNVQNAGVSNYGVNGDLENQTLPKTVASYSKDDLEKMDNRGMI